MLKHWKNTLLVQSGCVNRKRRRNCTPRVLFYHGVADTKDPFVEGLHIAPAVFRKQMAYLKAYYEPVSMDEYYRRLEADCFTGRKVVVTLDDGYRNNLTTAAPILQKMDIPFAVFISTHHIDTGELFPTFICRAVIMCKSLSRLRLPEIGLDCRLNSRCQRMKVSRMFSGIIKNMDFEHVTALVERIKAHLPAEKYRYLLAGYWADVPMNWQEVAALQEHYDCTIGAHCVEHFICDTFQSEGLMRRQIEDCKSRIEQKLGRPCLYFAYPNGNTCAAAEKICAEAGYRLAFTTDGERLSSSTSRWAMPRCLVDFNLHTFMAELALKPK